MSCQPYLCAVWIRLCRLKYTTAEESEDTYVGSTCIRFQDPQPRCAYPWVRGTCDLERGTKALHLCDSRFLKQGRKHMWQNARTCSCWVVPPPCVSILSFLISKNLMHGEGTEGKNVFLKKRKSSVWPLEKMLFRMPISILWATSLFWRWDLAFHNSRWRFSPSWFLDGIAAAVLDCILANLWVPPGPVGWNLSPQLASPALEWLTT